MKKRFYLFMIAVIAVSCLFAISVCAAEPDYNGETVTLSDNTVCPLYDTEGNGLLWYVASTDESGVNTYGYVANNATDTSLSTYVKYTTWNTSKDSYGVAVYQIQQHGIKIYVGTTEYATSAIVVANLRGCVVAGGALNSLEKTFQNCANLQHVYLPTQMHVIKGNSFINCSNLVTCDLTNTQIVEIGGNAFAETPLTTLGTLPNTVKKLAGCFEKMRKLEYINFPSSIEAYEGNVLLECNSLKSIDGLYSLWGENGALGTTIPQNMFSGCNALETFTIPDGITEIGSYAFRGCKAMTGALVFPNTVTTMGEQVVHSTGFDTVVLGGSYTTLSGNFFRDSTSLRTVYISANITTINAEAFRGCPANIVFFYTGSSAQSLIDATTASYNGQIVDSNVIQISYEEYLKAGSPEGRYIVYGIDNCTAFYGGHSWSNSPVPGATIDYFKDIAVQEAAVLHPRLHKP